MARYPVLFLALLTTVAAMSSIPGCGRKEADDIPPPPSPISVTKPLPKDKKPLEVESYDGVIRGKVVLEGDMPEIQVIDGMAKHADKDHCLEGKDFEKKGQRWIIGPNRGVANAVIFLKTPANAYFDMPENIRSRSDTVTIDQPHCAFIPHVQVAFPKYYDGKAKKLEPTGQRFEMKNSAKMPHNTKYKGDPERTGDGSVNIPPDGSFDLKSLTPEPTAIAISCDVHPWMYGSIWAFEHPFAARTKEDGTFEIKNVPTGVEVGLVAWHEGAGYFNGGKTGTPIKLSKGEVKEADFKVKAQ